MEKERIRADIAIVGVGGVVGCATARELSLRYPKKKIVGIEKLSSVCLETSRFNSGVIHSGLHQEPGSFRATFAREGSICAVEYITKARLPIMHTGMIIAIPKTALKDGLWREMGNLAGLVKRGKEQGIPFKYLTPWGVRKLEPNLSVLAGIFIPNVWVIDSVAFVESLYADARDAGVQFLFNQPVQEVVTQSSSYDLITPNSIISANAVVNVAGLYADQVAALAGFTYEVDFVRGEYYEIVGEKSKLVSRLIYPAVAHDSPGKGIHFSPRVDGKLFVGPNAKRILARNDYTGDKTPVTEFVNAVKRFNSTITENDMRWAYSGIRPKVAPAEKERDFIFSRDCDVPLWINAIGVESPGLSSAMAIAPHLCNLAEEHI